MLRTNSGSIGDRPPKTRVSPGRSTDTDWAASLTISPKSFHSGSISKSQWDLLFGSFQNMTASIMAAPGLGWVNRARPRVDRTPFADEHFLFGVTEDFETGAPQHGPDRSPVWNPPVGGVAGIFLFNEVHAGENGPIKDVLDPEVIVIVDGFDLRTAALHRLKHEQILEHMF